MRDLKGWRKGPATRTERDLTDRERRSKSIGDTLSWIDSGEDPSEGSYGGGRLDLSREGK